MVFYKFVGKKWTTMLEWDDFQDFDFQEFDEEEERIRREQMRREEEMRKLNRNY